MKESELEVDFIRCIVAPEGIGLTPQKTISLSSPANRGVEITAHPKGGVLVAVPIKDKDTGKFGTRYARIHENNLELTAYKPVYDETKKPEKTQ